MAFVGRTDVKDPGAQQHQWERLALRRERLYAEDAQFRDTRPDESVAEAVRRPGLRIAEAMATVMEGYADRPALGQRAREVITDGATGRSALSFLPRFDTVSYGELWGRVRAVASDWHHHRQHSVHAGDFVCVLGNIFTRLLFSLVATGVAPRSFYRTSDDGRRPHYEGLPVDFLAEVIAAVGPRSGNGYVSYNTTNPHDDGISLDTFVDWIAEAGYPIQRVDDYGDWVNRFETAMRSLPEHQRRRSALAVMDIYRRPAQTITGSPVPGEHFAAAVEESGRTIPRLSKELICKYLTDLKLIGALEK
jgi:hypothetical protein